MDTPTTIKLSNAKVILLTSSHLETGSGFACRSDSIVRNSRRQVR